MTKQAAVKAMAAAGIVGEVRGTRSRWEVELKDERTMRLFCRKVANMGGYRTGYGSWILQTNHVDSGDYCDKGSLWHR